MKKIIIIGIVLLAVTATTVVVVQRKKQPKNISSIPSSLGENSKEKNTVTTTQSEPLQPYFGDFEHDRDRDGIVDTKEKELGLSDEKSDSDGDGLSDTAEMDVYKTDPKKKDTDGDGYADGYEVLKGFNPNGAGKLDKAQ